MESVSREKDASNNLLMLRFVSNDLAQGSHRFLFKCLSLVVEYPVIAEKGEISAQVFSFAPMPD